MKEPIGTSPGKAWLDLQGPQAFCSGLRGYA